MSDRIADPWGARTPLAAGDAWPERVDRYLGDGVAEQDVDLMAQECEIDGRWSAKAPRPPATGTCWRR
jgi:hypothetical protein